MRVVLGIFAFIGILTLVGFLGGGILFWGDIEKIRQLDFRALNMYSNLTAKLLKTGSVVKATTWRIPVNDGLTPDDVEEVMKSVANEHNIKNVGILPLYKQVEAMSEKPYRFIKIYMFCNALTAAKLIDYDDAFSAYLPCRVILLQDKNKNYWLYTMNMDMMIYGGKPLPADVKKEALKVKEILTDIMKRGATGEF